MQMIFQRNSTKMTKRMKMSTEWKDQSAKCEGDAVLIGHINKSHLPQSHVDTLAQVLALVDKERIITQGHAPQRSEPSPTDIANCFKTLGRTLCVYLICLHETGS